MFKREDFKTKREDLVIEGVYYKSMSGLIMVTEIVPEGTDSHMGEELIAKAIRIGTEKEREIKIYEGHYCRPAKDEDYVQLLLDLQTHHKVSNDLYVAVGKDHISISKGEDYVYFDDIEEFKRLIEVLKRETSLL